MAVKERVTHGGGAASAQSLADGFISVCGLCKTLLSKTKVLLLQAGSICLHEGRGTGHPLLYIFPHAAARQLGMRVHTCAHSH